MVGNRERTIFAVVTDRTLYFYLAHVSTATLYSIRLSESLIDGKRKDISLAAAPFVHVQT